MSARRRFRVDQLPEASVLLDPGPSHHLLNVLRLGPGSRVRVFDGRGREQEVEVIAVEQDRARVEPRGEVVAAAPSCSSALLLASLKPKALDLALRMSVETGITDLIVYPAQRSVSRPPRLDRWSRITEAAAQQCGRADLPRLKHLPSLDDALLHARDQGWEAYVALPGADRLPAPSCASAVIIGPEGGLTEQEVRRVLQRGARPLGLGDWVLRADTAATLAAAWAASAATTG